MIKTIIFDFAGVVSTEQLTGWKKIAEKFGLDPEVTKERYYQNIDEYGRGGSDSTEKFWKHMCDGTDVSLADVSSIFVNWWKLNVDIVGLIEQLRSKYKVVLFSDNFDASTPSMRADAELNKLFSKMYFSNELGHTKAEQASFLALLKDLQCQASECIFVDDKSGPINTAKSLAVQSFQYSNYEQLIQDFILNGLLQ